MFVANPGDIHYGHSNTPTEHIIASMDESFPDTEETGKLDIIFLEGDLFDGLLHQNDPNVVLIMMWMWRFLVMCAKRNISLRVLEGTPSHDWGQSKLFLTVQRLTGVVVDLLYVDDLRIEYHPLGCTILYVPDEWRPDTNTTYMEVCQKLKEHGLDQVDLAVMHGAFEHQLPSHVKVPMHNAERYMALVKHYIFIGHIHKSSVKDRIIASGSLERLAHGEEEPKGHYRTLIDPDKGDRITFYENRRAQTYLTIDCTHTTLEEAFERLKVAKTVREGSYLRVLAHRDDPILVNIELLRRMYPDVIWSTKAQVGDTTQANLLVDLRSQYEEIQLSDSNLSQLIEQRMVAQGLDPGLIKRSLKLLAEAL